MICDNLFVNRFTKFTKLENYADKGISTTRVQELGVVYKGINPQIKKK